MTKDEKKLPYKTLIILTFFALLSLALNSIFAKIALGNNLIDPYSFTFYRLLFGSLTLIILVLLKNRTFSFSKDKNWLSSFLLFTYALSFSYAYVSLDAGFGTLVLFSAVQIFMFFISIVKKEFISANKIIGMLISFFGLCYLLYPQDNFQISYYHSILMLIAGISWASYSILGKNSKDSIFSTSDNFLKASFFIIIFYFIFIEDTFVSKDGILFAFISGSLSSAIGYVIWNKIVKDLEIITASIIQLLVPVLAIFLSILFLEERLTLTLLLSTLIIISGVFISLKNKN